MTPFPNSIFKWQHKLHTLLWCSQHLLLLTFQEGPFTSLLIHQPSFVCKVWELCIANHAMMCVCVCVNKAQVTKTFYPNIMQTLRNDLFSAVSLKKKCCLLLQQPNIHPTQTCDWNKKGGGAAGGGWISGSTETSCSGTYWSYLGYLHIIFRVKSGTKITTPSETGRGCSQFLP